MQPEELSGTPNVLNNITLLITYYDCLRKSLLFNNWYESFLMMQPLLGLPKWEMPPLLGQNIKGPKEREIRGSTTSGGTATKKTATMG